MSTSRLKSSGKFATPNGYGSPATQAPVAAQTPAPWPDLNDQLYVAGRAATADDIRRGGAVFLLGNASANDQSLGIPLKITIPQYAYHHEGSARTPCIVIQAESYADRRVVGCIVVQDHSRLVGLLEEFELLGTTSPPQ